MSASALPPHHRISETVAKLRCLCQLDVRVGWRYCDADLTLPPVNICNRPVAKLNEKGHIAWPAGKQVLHLGQQLIVPNNLYGYPVAGLRLLLGLTWWAEDAQIFVNGELVGRGDLFDCRDRVLLSSRANPGDEFLVILRLVSPGHDAGALMRSICLYEAADPACFDPAFVADELEILQNFLDRSSTTPNSQIRNSQFPNSQFPNSRTFNCQYLPNKIVADRSLTVKGKKLKSQFDFAVESIDWSALPDRPRFDRSLSVFRQTLLGYLRAFFGDLDVVNAPEAKKAEAEKTEAVFDGGENGIPTSIYIGEIGDRTSIYMGKISLLGHAHLDLAWLWPIEETWEVAQRTFESVLQLQSQFPELIFCHSTPALYAWIEEHRPDLFAAIKKQVAADRWEVVGGMWVEPDLNLISGESMVRQVVFGQRYAKEKFGELMRVAWFPDTFGFGWQLPQILRQGGVDYFVTQKLRWNDTTEFPFDAFLWEGLDGSQIFSMMSGPIGEGIESVKLASHVFDWQVKTGLQAAFWLPGVGDHGGGPTRDMLEVVKRWELSPFFPKLEFAKAIDYLSAIEAVFLMNAADDRPNLPVVETVENIGSIELANSDAIEETSPKSDVLAADNSPNLLVSETVENLQARMEESLLLARVSASNKPQNLAVAETGENVGSIELANSDAIEETSPKSDVLAADNSPNLPVTETSENLAAIDGKFSGKELNSKPKYIALDATEADSEKSELKNPSPLIPPTLPIWKDELYLEFHRGCYTTHADQKRQNRRCEELLYQAELLSSLATICTGAAYPKLELETAWKQVLFNQFHDILPGSAIAPVYAAADRAFAEVEIACGEIMVKSLDAIADRISRPCPPQPDARPILIFNPLNWNRSEVVAVSLPDRAWQVCDLSGRRLRSQIVPGDRTPSQFTLLFRASDIPAIGYRIFWLCPQTSQIQAYETAEISQVSNETKKKTELSTLTYGIAQKNAPCQETHFAGAKIELENEFFRATVDGETGNLLGIWDKINNREILNAAGGNQLQAFQDSGQYWDAWNIDPNYKKHQLPAPILKDIYWVDRGEVRQRLRAIRQIGRSEFCQDYTVEIGSPLLKIKTIVDWQEQHILVKTAFGLNLEAEIATCEIPCGAIERPTKPQTAAEKAKWEVPMLRWVDAGDRDFGVSLLNDCTYGCDIQPDRLRLTLLRSSTWPDETADRGIHQFTCAIYPHAGNWQNAGTVRRGYELNLPLLVKELPPFAQKRDRTLPAVGKLLDLSADNLILMAIKQSEDNPNLWILRCYESEGKTAVLELTGDLGLEVVEPVDLLERPTNLTEKLPQERNFKIEPWKISSFAVRYATEL